MIMGMRSTKSITQPQLRKIYVEARRAGIDDDYLHELIYNIHGKESLKELQMWEAAMLIDALVKMNGGGDRPGMITEKQEWLLKDYQQRLGWTDAQMRCFVKRCGHVEFIQWLTKERASKIIEAVKNIYMNKVKGGMGNVR